MINPMINHVINHPNLLHLPLRNLVIARKSEYYDVAISFVVLDHHVVFTPRDDKVIVIASVTEWSVAISRDYFVAPLLVMTKIHHYYPPTDGDKVPSPCHSPIKLRTGSGTERSEVIGSLTLVILER